MGVNIKLYSKIIWKYLLGGGRQAVLEQGSNWESEPPHTAPPFFGGGLLHDLPLTRLPVPQVWLQSPKVDQEDQPPSTEILTNIKNKLCSTEYRFIEEGGNM